MNFRKARSEKQLISLKLVLLMKPTRHFKGQNVSGHI